MMQLHLLLLVVAVALAQPTFAATTNVAVGEGLPPIATTTHETDNCLMGMLLLCSGTYTQTCLACATAHAQQLKADKCTNARIKEICNKAEMAVVNITITPPVADLDQGVARYAAPVQTVRVSHSDQSTAAPGYYDIKPLGPGGLLSIGVSADPGDRYYAFTTLADFHIGDGSVYAPTYMLQLRLEVYMGPISPVITLHWDNYMQYVGNTNLSSLDYEGGIASTRFNSSGTFVANDIIFQSGTSDDYGYGLGSGWVVRYAGGP